HSERVSRSPERSEGEESDTAQDKLREESLTYTFPLPSRERNKKRLTK
ncbi:unnamed protein product, partial [marine sediment metagenome]